MRSSQIETLKWSIDHPCLMYSLHVHWYQLYWNIRILLKLFYCHNFVFSIFILQENKPSNIFDEVEDLRSEIVTSSSADAHPSCSKSTQTEIKFATVTNTAIQTDGECGFET